VAPRGVDGEIERCIRSEYRRLVGAVAVVTGSTAAAEDAVQEAFAKLAARDTTGVREPEAYLRTMVVNECRTVMRRRRWHADTPVEDGIHLDRSDLEVREALARLNPRRRTVVVLCFYEDMKVDDIAELLGCRPGTVSSLLHRALKDLREVVGDD
jgi:RNA polymerase sigma factor (sigma-70 family)